MQLSQTVLRIQKTGASPEEYEDAYAPADRNDQPVQHALIAVSDGASEGYLSGPWAQSLVLGACKHKLSPHQRASSWLTRTLRDCRGSHNEWIIHYLAERTSLGKPIQWYEEPGLAKGGFATLLVLDIQEEAMGIRWSALAVGDSCIFQVRKGILLRKFPIEHSCDFTGWPYLLRSIQIPGESFPHARIRHGNAIIGDEFFLMTDAISAWFLQSVESGRNPWGELKEGPLTNHASFPSWVADLRTSGRLHNDDTTILYLKII